MKTNNYILLFCFSLPLAYCGNNGQKPNIDPAPINTKWANDKLWDDGKAEVASYDATRIVYGKPRQFEYTYVLVKESFNEEYNVKTDDYSRDDLYEVMKINKFCQIPTLAYPYHYLTSIFVRRNDTGDVHKLTNTSQEWCGNTAKSFLEKGKSYQFDYMSYWDGEGNGSAKVDKKTWFEDQLSYTLRSLNFEDGLTFSYPMYPTQINSRAKIPQAETTTFEVSYVGPDNLDSLNQTFTNKAWRVLVSREAGPEMTFWFGFDYPNYLLKMESSDGRKLQLKSITRDAYWAQE